MSASLFAQTLKGILDDTNLYKRSEWAIILGVHSSKIDNWVSDAEIPEASTLRSIVRIFQESDPALIPQEPLSRFEKMASRPAISVSPHGHRMDGTVNHYILQPLRKALDTLLMILPPAEAEAIIWTAAKECHKVRDSVKDGSNSPKKLFEMREGS